MTTTTTTTTDDDTDDDVDEKKGSWSAGDKSIFPPWTGIQWDPKLFGITFFADQNNNSNNINNNSM